MVCRLEKQRKHLGNVEASVFDEIISDTYHRNKRSFSQVDQTEKKKAERNVLRNKKGSVAGTLNYLAPGASNFLIAF